MTTRHKGYMYDNLGDAPTTAQIAAAIRADVKTAVAEGLLPRQWRYSVRSRLFAGGSAIDVQVKSCPDAWQECDGMRVGSRRTLPDGTVTGTGCGNVWCKAGGQYRDQPYAETHQVLTEDAEVARLTLERIHNAYNHDGSDVTTDYFDVRYYGTVTFER